MGLGPVLQILEEVRTVYRSYRLRGKLGELCDELTLFLAERAELTELMELMGPKNWFVPLSSSEWKQAVRNGNSMTQKLVRALSSSEWKQGMTQKLVRASVEFGMETGHVLKNDICSVRNSPWPCPEFSDMPPRSSDFGEVSHTSPVLKQCTTESHIAATENPLLGATPGAVPLL